MCLIRKNNTFLSKFVLPFLCGACLLVLFLVFSVPLNRAAELLESNKKELSLKETNNLIRQKREEIRQIQSKINGYESEIKAKQRKERTLKRELAIYNSRIKKNELEIKQTQLAIEKIKMEIEKIKSKIEKNEEKIESNKGILKKFIKLLYNYEQDSMFEVLMSEGNLSDFFSEISAVESIKNKIFTTIIDLKNEKEELNRKIHEMEEQQEQKGQLIEIKFQQNRELKDLKKQKNEILKSTKGEEIKFQQILEKNRNILPFLRAQLHELQSLGKKIKFDDAFSAAKYIGSITGVRPSYLLGILRVESGLGTNVGGGNYKVDMRRSQRPVFEKIVLELGYNPDKMPVSRRPKNYRGWGGAMGPAQMMPTTWMTYKNEISEITGHYPPDPWNLTDAIAAIAAKTSKVPGVTEGDYNAEYEAAGIYFAGRNWKKKKLLFYPNRVMLYADLYAKELGN